MIEIRRCENDDQLRVSTEIYNRVWPRSAVTVEEARAWHESNDESVELLGDLDRMPVGSAVASIGPPRPDRVFTLITVLADARRCGVGTALYEAVSAWARERDRATLDTWVYEGDPSDLEYALRRGFVEESREAGLELRLAGVEPPAVDAPEGVAIVTLAERPDLAVPLYDVAREAFPDIPGAEDEIMRERDDWVQQHLHSAGNDPNAIWIAVAGREPVAYAKLRLSPARGTAASHGMTAVKRAWRGRGIAQALKRAQIAWAIENGIETLQTTNEVRNAPMQAVNRKLGYTDAPGRIFLVGPTAAT